MIDTYFNDLDVLYHHAKFGEIEQRAPAVCENVVFVVSFYHAPRPALCSFDGV